MRKLFYAISFWVWAVIPVALFGETSQFQQSPASTVFSIQQKGATLRFHVAGDNAHFVADVYTLSGKHIARVLDKIISHGDYLLSPFAGRNLPLQTYVIRLSNGVQTEAIRMMNRSNESVSNSQSIRTSSASLAKIESANASNKVITGVVTDANNSPLNQVKVSLDSVNYVFTGVDGKFTIGVGNIVSSRTHPRYLIFENSGYAPAARYINPDSQQTSVQVHLITIDNAKWPTSANGDKVKTPSGLRLKSQCFQIEHGHSVNFQGGQIREIDASENVVRNFGAVTNRAGTQPLWQIEWLIAANWLNNTGLTEKVFSASWTVPSDPTTHNGQVIGLFNAIEQVRNDTGVAILQPVLQWIDNGYNGGSWSVISMYVFEDGTAYYTSPVTVSNGDPLVGDIIERSNPAPGLYRYGALFEGIGGTDLEMGYVPELTWNFMTLEAYNADFTSCPEYCTDYPADGYTMFTGIYILTGLTYPPTYPTLSWSAGYNEDPPCNTYCGFRARVWSNANPNGVVELYY